MKVGIVGFGKMGRIRYGVLKELPGVEVVGVYDPNYNDDIEGLQKFKSAESLIQDGRINSIFLCVPNYLIRPLVIQSLRAGKHVFSEKPPAMNAREMEEIIATENECKGLKLMYGFNHRHHDSIKVAHEKVKSGQYGKVLWIRGRYGKSVDSTFYNDWRSKKELAGGGILIDQGIHMLDLFLHFAGEFDEVLAYVSNLYWKLDVEDNVFAILRNKNGLVASLHSTMTQWRHLFSLEIFLEKGYIVINGLLTTSGSYGDEVMTIAKNRTTAPAASWSDEEHIRFTVDTSWKSEVVHFVSSVKENTPIAFGTSEEALKLMRLVDRIYAQK